MSVGISRDSKIYIPGHTGLVGSSIVRLLQSLDYDNLVLRTHSELDLANQEQVKKLFSDTKPEYVFMCAGKVGGIGANLKLCADFIYQNIAIATNVIHHSYLSGVKKLLYLGSSCIYPRLANQPIKETELLSGYLEPTNEAYAVAKIAGVKLCQNYRRQYGCDFISAMPCNLYGSNDNYKEGESHVIPSLVRKFIEAKGTKVEVWGMGVALREFLHADDLARACLILMQKYSDIEIINVGSGEEVSIKQLVNLVSSAVGYTGEVLWDESRPDGMPRKILDSSRISGYWSPQISLEEGIRMIVHDYK